MVQTELKSFKNKMSIISNIVQCHIARGRMLTLQTCEENSFRRTQKLDKFPNGKWFSALFP